jgi:subtilisin family serine protease
MRFSSCCYAAMTAMAAMAGIGPTSAMPDSTVQDVPVARQVEAVSPGELVPVGRLAWSSAAVQNRRHAPMWTISARAGSREPARSPVWAGYDPRRSVPDGRDWADGIEIRLQQAHFDPVTATPKLAPALAGSPERAGSERGYRLVQFDGPIEPAWREALEAMDVEILEYVPDFAYLVRVDAARATALETHERVRWTGDYLPAFRLSNLLLDAALRALPDHSRELYLRSFQGESVDAVRRAVEQAGALVIDQGSDSGGGAIFRVRASDSTLVDLAHIPAVAWIEPLFPIAPGNEIARSNTILGKDRIEAELGYYGAGQVAAVTDSGMSTGDTATLHGDFNGRVIGWSWGYGSCETWADEDGHGTHVAGSVLGSGSHSGANPATSSYTGSQAGLAPEAELVVWSACADFSSIPNHDLYNLFWGALYQFDTRLRVNNNSWGQIDPSTYGTYNITARETDRFMFDFPDMVGVMITQNIGRDTTGDGVSDLGTATPPGTAKNVIAVGAAENLRFSGGYTGAHGCATWGGATCWGTNFPNQPLSGDQVSDNLDGMAAFSGRGPTLSNRLKPDIVAPGTNVLSARNESHIGGAWGLHDAQYAYMGGTSMAAPLVAGGAVIVREFFQRQFGHNPTSALVKAVLINGADDMSPGQFGTGAGQDVWGRPDPNQGWGRMNLARSVLFDDHRRPAYFEAAPGLQTGQQGEVAIELAHAGHPLRVTLVWTDRHGMENTHGALVNDLDLEVVDPGGNVHLGWAGLTGVERDRFNNYEEVSLASAPAGSYTLRVVGHNVPLGPQPFAVVVTGALDAPADLLFSDRFE